MFDQNTAEQVKNEACRILNEASEGFSKLAGEQTDSEAKALYQRCSNVLANNSNNLFSRLGIFIRQKSEESKNESPELHDYNVTVRQ